MLEQDKSTRIALLSLHKALSLQIGPMAIGIILDLQSPQIAPRESEPKIKHPPKRTPLGIHVSHRNVLCKRLRYWNWQVIVNHPLNVKCNRFMHVLFYFFTISTSCNASGQIRRVSKKILFDFLNN